MAVERTQLGYSWLNQLKLRFHQPKQWFTVTSQNKSTWWDFTSVLVSNLMGWWLFKVGWDWCLLEGLLMLGWFKAQRDPKGICTGNRGNCDCSCWLTWSKLGWHLMTQGLWTGQSRLHHANFIDHRDPHQTWWQNRGACDINGFPESQWTVLLTKPKHLQKQIAEQNGPLFGQLQAQYIIESLAMWQPAPTL